MKRLICLLLAVLLLGSACAVENIKEPLPVFDEDPVPTESKIVINGSAPFEIYTLDGKQYVNIKDIAENTSASFSIEQGNNVHKANLLYEKTVYTMTTDSQGAEIFKDCLYDGADWYVDAKEIMAIFNFSVLEDVEQKTTYYTSYPKSDSIPEGAYVPTLMYHAVSDNVWSSIASLFVSPSKLEDQLKYLVDNGYTPIFFEDLANVDKIQKPVLLTFDDGYDDNYTELFPLLKKYNVKATVFLITGSVGTQHYLTQEQIKEMNESGLVSFQSHTVTHPYLDQVDEQTLEYEHYQSKLDVARLTGKEPFVLCYPSGRNSQASIEKTKEHYQFGLLMSGATYKTGNNPYRITRKYISRSTGLSDFISMIS